MHRESRIRQTVTFSVVRENDQVRVEMVKTHQEHHRDSELPKNYSNEADHEAGQTGNGSNGHVE
jgi:hypothetical protein